jgi:putative DNA methylase
MHNQEDLESPAHEKGWYARGYLPHFEGGAVMQMLTFRLIDAFPEQRLLEWEEELAKLPFSKAEMKRRLRIEEYLDKGRGSAWLSRPDIAKVTSNALLHFNGTRYLLHAWVVMPNHVHVLMTLRSGESLAQILHSWKSFTANKANRLIGRTGSFWQREFFDRLVRNEEHFRAAIDYIEHNPVKAGLCVEPADWRFSSAATCTK